MSLLEDFESAGEAELTEVRERIAAIEQEIEDFKESKSKEVASLKIIERVLSIKIEGKLKRGQRKASSRSSQETPFMASETNERPTDEQRKALTERIVNYIRSNGPATNIQLSDALGVRASKIYWACNSCSQLKTGPGKVWKLKEIQS